MQLFMASKPTPQHQNDAMFSFQQLPSNDLFNKKGRKRKKDLHSEYLEEFHALTLSKDRLPFVREIVVCLQYSQPNFSVRRGCSLRLLCLQELS
ncbi:hypothetical protein KFK09_028460 [Dendrobium nobile]|uniref:Uncharacterized protein n=1 Tax=Dendrobium nobile TaxID=94219 RepID=A0A8T3A356_DENNO|nr:hypothetical protein KFK09_028460 [Dendrobium nobile]